MSGPHTRDPSASNAGKRRRFGKLNCGKVAGLQRGPRNGNDPLKTHAVLNCDVGLNGHDFAFGKGGTGRIADAPGFDCLTFADLRCQGSLNEQDEFASFGDVRRVEVFALEFRGNLGTRNQL